MLEHRSRCSIAPLTRRYAPTSPLRGEVIAHNFAFTQAEDY